jgi:hypothetical protein
VLEREVAVHSNRVVDGRHAHVGEVEQPITETLVVVDDIVVGVVLGEVLHDPLAERVRLGESTGEHARPLEELGRLADVLPIERAEPVLLVDDVLAREFDEAHIRREVGVGSPGNHVHRVAAVGECPTEVLDVVLCKP